MRRLTEMLEKIPESLGRALINQRAGMEHVVYNALHRERETARLSVTSPAFVFNGRIPARYTADGEGMSPPLSFDSIPSGAGSLAIIVEDADSPTPHPLVHAIVVDIDPALSGLDEGALNSPHHVGAGFETGQNSFFRQAWLPPDPPPGHGEHRYVFQVFALIPGPDFSRVPGRREFIDAVLNRAVAVGCLIGTYQREARDDVEVGEIGEVEHTAGALEVSA